MLTPTQHLLARCHVRHGRHYGPGFDFPAVGRKKITAAFDGGRLNSDGGVMLAGMAEKRLGIVDHLARLIADRRDPTRNHQTLVWLAIHIGEPG